MDVALLCWLIVIVCFLLLLITARLTDFRLCDNNGLKVIFYCANRETAQLFCEEEAS